MASPPPRNPAPAQVARNFGNRAHGGELSAGVKGDRVWVNAFVGAGLTVELSADAALQFADLLTRCAREAKRNQGR